jgi:hypothetical protein
MSSKPIRFWRLPSSGGPAQQPSVNMGHAHFRARVLSRRQFLETTAGITGLALGASLLTPLASALFASPPASTVLPNPIPGGLMAFGNLFHVVLPASGKEPSTITDFNGIVGGAHVGGTGTGVDSSGSQRLIFDADCRFMDGVYVGVDGKVHRGAIGFV